MGVWGMEMDGLGFAAFFPTPFFFFCNTTDPLIKLPGRNNDVLVSCIPCGERMSVGGGEGGWRKKGFFQIGVGAGMI
jgi:hypothetical protein